jgi:hypothetical protein
MDIFINAGFVEYNINEARVSIDEFIAMLEEAKEDGATHLVGLSGNYRGAKFVRISTAYSYNDEDEEF